MKNASKRKTESMNKGHVAETDNSWNTVATEQPETGQSETCLYQAPFTYPKDRLEQANQNHAHIHTLFV